MNVYDELWPFFVGLPIGSSRWERIIRWDDPLDPGMSQECPSYVPLFERTRTPSSSMS